MKPRAIIIDDDESCRDVLALILRQKGYETFGFAEPAACPLYADATCQCPHEYVCGDFLLIDNQMPRMSGLDFIEAQVLRGCKGAVCNKAIISGTLCWEDAARAERLGCKIFYKPVCLDELLAWLDEQRKKIHPERKLVVFKGDAPGC